ncbi:unnamed protein product [Brugia timori]|uniref:Uncharacterized protein n=1 Tax=Brugia timori TaxID=42155 RepID=A0A0R3R5D3_9BILA|nr:unnamed protein product [Brugia timori]
MQIRRNKKIISLEMSNLIFKKYANNEKKKGKKLQKI